MKRTHLEGQEGRGGRKRRQNSVSLPPVLHGENNLRCFLLAVECPRATPHYPKPSQALTSASSAGRTLRLLRSENGIGYRMTSPRAKLIEHVVSRVIPDSGQRILGELEPGGPLWVLDRRHTLDRDPHPRLLRQRQGVGQLEHAALVNRLECLCHGGNLSVNPAPGKGMSHCRATYRRFGVVPDHEHRHLAVSGDQNRYPDRGSSGAVRRGCPRGQSGLVDRPLFFEQRNAPARRSASARAGNRPRTEPTRNEINRLASDAYQRLVDRKRKPKLSNQNKP
jgi:hypothetical protein